MALLKPALVLNFGKTKKLDTRISFSRGSVATYFNDRGELVASGGARFNHDPISGYCKGLLVEAAATNIVPNSLLNGTSHGNVSVTTTAQQYTISFYGTGTIILSGSVSSTIYGSGTFPARTTFSFSASAGVLNIDITGTAQYLQVEAGSYATSFIPTAASPVTRLKDVVSIVSPNFTPWYNQSEGTFVVNGDSNGATTANIFSVSETLANTNTLMSCYINNTTDTVGTASNAGVQQENITIANAHKVGEPFAVVNAYKANDFVVMTSESIMGADTSGTVSSVMARLDIGSSNEINQLNGHIYSLIYYNTRLVATDIRALARENSYPIVENAPLNFDFIRRPSLPPGVFYSRADTAATYFNSAGVLSTAAVNEPRFDYDPVSLTCEGLLIEESSTNLIAYSTDFGNITRWSGTCSLTTGQSDIAGGTNATIVADTSNSSLSQLIHQAFTCNINQPYTASIFIKKDSIGRATRTPMLSILFVGSTKTADLCIDTATGEYALTNYSVGLISFAHGVVDCGSWWRVWLTAATSDINDNAGSVIYKFYPDVGTNFNTTYSNTGTGSCTIFGAMFEARENLTSYIATNGVAVTRTLGQYGLYNNAFTNWFNPSEGTFTVTAVLSGKTTSQYPRVFQVTDDTNAEQMSIFYDTTDYKIKAYVVDGNVEQFNSSNENNPISYNVPFTHTLSYKANNFSSLVAERPASKDNSGTLPTTTLLRIGSGTAGTNGWNGYIKKLKYFPKAMETAIQRNLVR